MKRLTFCIFSFFLLSGHSAVEATTATPLTSAPRGFHTTRLTILRRMAHLLRDVKGMLAGQGITDEELPALLTQDTATLEATLRDKGLGFIAPQAAQMLADARHEYTGTLHNLSQVKTKLGAMYAGFVSRNTCIEKSKEPLTRADLDTLKRLAPAIVAGSVADDANLESIKRLISDYSNEHGKENISVDGLSADQLKERISPLFAEYTSIDLPGKKMFHKWQAGSTLAIFIVSTLIKMLKLNPAVNKAFDAYAPVARQVRRAYDLKEDDDLTLKRIDELLDDADYMLEDTTVREKTVAALNDLKPLRTALDQARASATKATYAQVLSALATAGLAWWNYDLQ